MRGQLVLVFAGENEIKGGARESETKDCAANPTSASSSKPATTTTPVQN